MNDHKCNCNCNNTTNENVFDPKNFNLVVLCGCKASSFENNNEESNHQGLNQQETFSAD
jgi:hypothetical protein